MNLQMIRISTNHVADNAARETDDDYDDEGDAHQSQTNKIRN